MDESYAWASTVIDELRKQGFTPLQIKNILPHLLIESNGGRANAVQGDWSRNFKGDSGSFNVGRGFIQLTGYDNYRKMEEMTGIPLTKDPKLAANPEYSARIAAAYLKKRQQDFGKYQDLSYSTFESVHRALAPKNNNPQDRIKHMEKQGWRLATDEDLTAHTPAYDPSAWSVNEDGSLSPNTTPPKR